MSVFDGFLNMMRLGPDDDDDFYDDFDVDEPGGDLPFGGHHHGQDL